MTESQPANSSSPPGFRGALQWSVASIGLSGLLAALGYVVRFSEENFLGVSLGSDSAADNLFLQGGAFIAFLCTYILDHLWIFSLILLVSFAVSFLLHKAASPKVSLAIAFALAVVGMECLFLGVMPWLRIEKLLFKPPPVTQLQGPRSPWPWGRAPRENWLSEAVVCSRINCGFDATAPGRYQARLDASFGFIFLATTALIISSMGTISKWWTEPSGGSALRNLVFSTLVLLLMLDSLSVPFVYSKTKLDLHLQDAQIIVQGENQYYDLMENPAEPTGMALIGDFASKENRPSPGVSLKMEEPKRPKPGEPSAKPGAPEFIFKRFHAFILSQTASYWTLYNQDAGEIWLLPSPPLRSVRISTVRISREGDILRARFTSPQFSTEVLQPLKEDALRRLAPPTTTGKASVRER